MQLIAAGNSLDRSYLAAVNLGHGNETTVHYPVVDDHGARATLTFTAAFLRAGELQLFAQDVEQARHRKHFEHLQHTVDLAFY
jgi:hypothetical protein